MAPSNAYLMDDSVLQRLAQHNRRLVKIKTECFPGEDSEEHRDFHRPVELELLGNYLSGFAYNDFVDHKVTVVDAAHATYGYDDEYLVGRITGTHLIPSSEFNKGPEPAKPGRAPKPVPAWKTALNGQVYVADGNGRIMCGSRRSLAEDAWLTAKGKSVQAMGRKAEIEGRKLNTAERKAGRIDPTYRAELQAQHEQAALEMGEQTRQHLEGE